MIDLKELIGKDEYQQLVKRTYNQGTYLLSGDEKNLYFIQQGNVVISHNYIEGENLFPYVFGKNQIIGHLKNMSKYTATFEYIAVTKVKVLIIPYSSYIKWKMSNIKFLNYLHSLAFDINESSFLYNYLRLERGFESSFAYAIYKFNQEGIFYYRNISTLSKSFNVSRTTMYYYINKLEKLKIIRNEKKKGLVVISDQKLLDIFHSNFLFAN